MVTIAECKSKYNSGKYDILYRFKVKTSGRYTGWRSFKKANSGRNTVMWPWNMPYHNIEWKLKKL